MVYSQISGSHIKYERKRETQWGIGFTGVAVDAGWDWVAGTVSSSLASYVRSKDAQSFAC